MIFSVILTGSYSIYWLHFIWKSSWNQSYNNPLLVWTTSHYWIFFPLTTVSPPHLLQIALFKTKNLKLLHSSAMLTLVTTLIPLSFASLLYIYIFGIVTEIDRIQLGRFRTLPIHPHKMWHKCKNVILSIKFHLGALLHSNRLISSIKRLNKVKHLLLQYFFKHRLSPKDLFSQWKMMFFQCSPTLCSCKLIVTNGTVDLGFCPFSSPHNEPRRAN